MDELQIPAQDEINRLASYFSISLKLSRSPFFRQDTMRLEYTGRGGDEPEAVLCDPEILISTVMTFRKLKSNDKATNHVEMNKILKRHSPNNGARIILDGMSNMIKRTLKTWDHEPVQGYGVSPRELLRIVINSEHAHAGYGKSRKQATRPEYERLCNALTKTQVEYLFEMALMRSGMAIYQHSYIVPAAISYFVSIGAPKPNVQVQSEVAQYLGIEPISSNVLRDTPGYTPKSEDRATSLERVLRRRKYGALKGIIQAVYGDLGIDYEELCTHRNLVDWLKARRITWHDCMGEVSQERMKDLVKGRSFVGPDECAKEVGEFGIFRDGSIEFRRSGRKILWELYSDALYCSQIDPIEEREKGERELILQHYHDWV